MAKKTSNDGWWLAGLLIAGGLGLLYYAQTGFGKEKDSALIPNALEGRIDALIALLNKRFGKSWVDLGVAVLRHNLQTTLPTSLVTLVNIVATVENMSKGLMASHEKLQLAVQMARAT